MAGYKGHIAGATVCCGLAIAGVAILPGAILAKTGGLLSNWQMVAGLFVVAILFGLWPDIDTNSKGQDIFFGTAFIFDIILIWQGYIEAAAFLGLLAMTPVLGKHRGWTHSKLAMILVPLPLLVIPYIYKQSLLQTAILFYAAAVIGYFSHLLLDGLITKRIRFKT
jgi:membrane-bound metal-dependent hydrolase YbcI (DUF457 family)